MGNTQASLTDTIIQLKMTQKQLARLSKKAEADAAKEKSKVKKYLEKNDKEAARIYAENAIRKKNEGLSYLRMAGRVDAVISRLQTAESMKMITKQMGGVVRGMDAAMQSMNLEQMAQIMDKFESTFTELDVRAGVLESGMQSGVSSTMPEHQIDSLLTEVADEHNLDVASALDSPSLSMPQQTAENVGQLSTTEEQALAQRLASLRS
jgi:charged multivesicular body protein 1